MPNFNWTWLGQTDYEEALGLQEALWERRQAGEISDHLLLLEHPPVLTVGRGGDAGNILASPKKLMGLRIPVHRINRGGDVTYHGPGQLVGYPILDLRERGRDAHRYLRDLEEVFLKLLAERGINAHRVPGRTGVWAGNAKILAIGVGLRRWTTLHGFAFNVRMDLSPFNLIRPCGFEMGTVTSLEAMEGQKTRVEDLVDEVVARFAEVFGMEGEPLHKDELFLPVTQAATGGSL
jgi:lipoyl(octanoyl) transferase